MKLYRVDKLAKPGGVVIKKKHILASSDQQAGKQAEAPQSAPADGGGADKDAIVAECVEQVVQILQARKER